MSFNFKYIEREKTMSNQMYNKYVEIMKNNNLLENKEIVFLCSGGKDATFGLEFILQFVETENIDVNITVLLVEYPKHVYYDENGNKRKEYADYITKYKKQGVNIKTYLPKSDDIIKETQDGCKVCKQSRKKIVDNEIAKIMKTDKRVTIVTGYTLFDVMAYVEELLLYTDYTLNVGEKEKESVKKRIRNCLHKMRLRENLPNGNTIIRPLLYFDEIKILEYMKNNKIGYVSTPCIYGKNKHKRLYFETLNAIGGNCNVTYNGIMELLEKKGLLSLSGFDDLDNEQFFIDC